MFIIDRPYVSDFLRTTINRNQFPVVKTDSARQLGFENGQNLLEEERALEMLRSADQIRLYSNSENAIGWITKNLTFTDIPDKIALFKNKARFRQLLRPLYPHFYFREVAFSELEHLSIAKIPFPFIIKPTVGFFSFGVYKIINPQQWSETKNTIRTELKKVAGIFPEEVFSSASFIIEQVIQGEEFAVDTYFDAQSQPVILNILQHVFSSEADVGDRIYMTSREILKGHYSLIDDFLQKIGPIFGVKNFPVHVEIRIDKDGVIQPIEINPMRFGGWCTTPDLAYHAYGFNAYEYYMNQKSPDWSKILENKDSKVYSLIVLDNSTGWDASQIATFDYAQLLNSFEKPLELRKLDINLHPVFGFLFTESNPDNMSELENILKSNLREFVIHNKNS